MKAICENELVIECAGYKAIDSGVVLMGDEDSKNVIAFIPNEKLEYLLPDDVVEREHERLGLPAPEISSAEDLESRMEEFAAEIDQLRESLDRQVEDLIDEGAAFEEENLERQDCLHERRRTIDRQLQQVKQRARQFRQLSTMEGETEEEEAVTGETTDAEGADASRSEIDELKAEMDERFETIQQQLEALGAEPNEEHVDTAASEFEAEEEGGEAAESHRELDGIKGLGSTYKQRLEDAGIESVEDLAAKSPDEVADAANAPVKRATEWIEQAKAQLAEGEQEASA